MNPLTNTKNQNILNERELRLGYTGTVSSWHRQYKDSAWIFIGGLNFELTEGDVICVFSQYGEVVNINLVRDKKTGQSKGFAFLCYEDQRSTVLATDNLNGIKVAGRTIRVDHVEQYKVPKEGTLDVGTGDGKKDRKRKPDVPQDPDAVASFVREHGCGPEVMSKLQKMQKEQERLEKEKAERMAATRQRPPIHHRRSMKYEHRRSPPDDRDSHDNRPYQRPIRNRSPSVSPARRSSPHRSSRGSSISPPRRRATHSPPRIKQESPPTTTQRNPSPHSHYRSSNSSSHFR